MSSSRKRLYKTSEPAHSDDSFAGSQLVERSAHNRSNIQSWNVEEKVPFNGAKDVVQLILPVSICMFVVVATTSSIPYYTQTKTYDPSKDQTVDTHTKLLQTFYSVCILMKVIHGYLILMSFNTLFAQSSVYLCEVLRVFDIQMDYITLYVIMWNFLIVGMICIHWKGPLLLQQAYLIHMSALRALFYIKNLPEWTAWFYLGVNAMWDLISVLWQYGPLRILAETAQERKEYLFPALVYSSAMMCKETRSDTECVSERMHSGDEAKCNDQGNTSADTDVLKEKGPYELSENQASIKNRDIGECNREYSLPLPARGANTEKGEGAQLGLGDFIYYSILVSKASSYGDWNTTLACFVAVLIGLWITMILGKIFKKAMPALPISIGLGLIFYINTSSLVQPFVNSLASAQVYI